MKRWAGLIAVGVALLAAFPGGTAAASALRACPNANVSALDLTKDQVRGALHCLFNKARSAQNLKYNGALEKAAQDHSALMAKKRTLSHQLPGEPDTKTRVKRTGYSNSPYVGEVILQLPKQAAPSQVMGFWLGSPDHREIIQGRAFKHLGIGLGIAGEYAYYTGVLAHR